MRIEEVGGATLINGDCREVMAALPENSLDSIVCDPPYGLSFMGKGWDHGVPGREFWVEALRVAKPGAYLLAFGGTRTHHRLMVAIEDAGWEIRDCVMWVYGSGFPKSHNGEWGGTALKPAWEPIILARKPLIGTVAANVQQYGTGGLNIDGCRVEGGERPWREARRNEESDATRNAYASGLAGSKAVQDTDTGRWPANLIHDGSEEVVACFPDSKGQLAAARTDGAAQGNAVWSAMNHVTTNPEPRGDTGSAARFFYCAKASKSDRNEGCDDLPLRKSGMVSNTSGQHITRRDGGAPGPTANNHPTVKPTALMRYLCRLVTRPDGTILDPFMGSGSTGKAALLEGFNFVGIELDEEHGYFDIALARIAHAAGLKAAA